MVMKVVYNFLMSSLLFSLTFSVLTCHVNGPCEYNYTFIALSVSDLNTIYWYFLYIKNAINSIHLLLINVYCLFIW